MAVLCGSTFLFGGVSPDVHLTVRALLLVSGALLLVRVRPSPPSAGFLAFGVCLLLLALVSPRPADSLDAFATLVAYLSLYLLANNALREPGSQDLLLRFLIGTATLLAGYGILSFLADGRHVLWLPKLAYLDSATGTFINRNHFGAYCGLHLLLALAVTADFPPRWTRSMQLLVLAGGVLASNSRGALLTAALGVVLIAIHRYRRYGSWRWTRGRFLALVFATAVLAPFAVRIGPRLRALMHPATDGSLQARPLVWGVAVDSFLERPWTGFGPGTFEPVFWAHRTSAFRLRVSHAHNDAIEVLVGVGTLGTVAIFLSVIAFLRESHPRAWPGPGARTELAIATGSIPAHGLFDFPLAIPALAMHFVVCVALLRRVGDDPRPLRTAGRSYLGRLPLVALFLAALFRLLTARYALVLGSLAEREQDPRRERVGYAELATLLDPFSPEHRYTRARLLSLRQPLAAGLADTSACNPGASAELDWARMLDRVTAEPVLKALHTCPGGSEAHLGTTLVDAVRRFPRDERLLRLASGYWLGIGSRAGWDLLGEALKWSPWVPGPWINSLLVAGVDRPRLASQFLRAVPEGRLEMARLLLLRRELALAAPLYTSAFRALGWDHVSVHRLVRAAMTSGGCEAGLGVVTSLGSDTISGTLALELAINCVDPEVSGGSGQVLDILEGIPEAETGVALEELASLAAAGRACAAVSTRVQAARRIADEQGRCAVVALLGGFRCDERLDAR